MVPTRPLTRPDVDNVPPSSDAYGQVVRIAGLAPLMGVGSTQFAVSNPTWLTNTQLRAAPINVVFPSTQQILVGEVEIKNDSGNPVPVTGPLTAAQLAASVINVASTGILVRNSTAQRVPGRVTQDGTWSVGVTNPTTQVKVSNPTWLTDTQLRATPVPIVSTGVKLTNPTTAVRVNNTTSQRVPGRVTQDGAPWALTSTSVKLVAGTATIGKVDQGVAGAASWLMTSTSVKLAAGAATIGKADQGAAGAAAWPVKSTGVAVSNPTWLTDTQLRASVVPVTSTRWPTVLAGDGGFKIHDQTPTTAVRVTNALLAVTSTATKLAAGAATIGKVDQGAAGSASWPFTSTSVKLAAGAATVGKVDQGAAGAAPWPMTSTSVKLAAGSAVVGKVDQNGAPWSVTSTSMKLAAGAAVIGKVDQNGAPWSVTSTGVKLAAGAATVGKVDQGAAGGTAWPVKSTGVTVTNTTMSLSAATLAALESISVQNTTGAAVPTMEQAQLVPKKFDYIGLSYSTISGATGRKLSSAVYKTGGSGGTLQATLTLGYSTLALLASVTRT